MACSDDFVRMFPDLKSSEPGSGFRGKAALRDVQQILPKLDLAYCLHWGIVENGLRSYGHEAKTLRCPVYFSMTMSAATFTNARKLAAFFS
jgi:hypothetical protein